MSAERCFEFLRMNERAAKPLPRASRQSFDRRLHWTCAGSSSRCSSSLFSRMQGSGLRHRRSSQRLHHAGCRL